MVADNGYYVNGSSTPIWVEVLPNQPVITISGNATAIGELWDILTH